MPGIPHPYMTSELPGIGGTLKSECKDFIVEEVPSYLPGGAGEHTYCLLEKENLSTFEAIRKLSGALGVSRGEFGYAGLKDRKGVTRQWVSVRGVSPADVQALALDGLTLREVTRHTNKLRVGHLRGNRFEVWVRGVHPDAADRVPRVFQQLTQRGIPNYYGLQRFGNRGYAHRIGRDLVRREPEAAIQKILGCHVSGENNPHVVRAREAFSAGKLGEAREAFPGSYREERRVLDHLRKSPQDFSGAARRLEHVTAKLYVTAYQSYLFNLTVDERMRRVGGDLGRFLRGDLAFLHRNGAVFAVEDVDEAQSRASTFEVSPSGPTFAARMATPYGVPLEIEECVLKRDELGVEELAYLTSQFRLDGGRRPLRVPVADLEWRLEGGDLYLEFFLPKGCYATTLLRELMKNDDPSGGFYADGEGDRHELFRPRGGPLAQ